MIGDGIGSRGDVTFNLATDGTILVAAPGAGLEIAVYVVNTTCNPSTVNGFEDSGAVTLFSLVPSQSRVVQVSSPVPLFRCGDNEPLNSKNPSLSAFRGQVVFEIRPTGL